EWKTDQGFAGVVSIGGLDTTTLEIQTIKFDAMFKTNFARIGPFILSKGRQVISRKIEPHIDSIVRIHTDGFLATQELNIETGDNIGQVKYKGYCKKVEIPHAYKVNCRA